MHTVKRIIILFTNYAKSDMEEELNVTRFHDPSCGVRRFIHISPSWVKIRLHTKNQHRGLSGSALKVCAVVRWCWGGVGVVRWVPPNYVVTPTLNWFEVGL